MALRLIIQDEEGATTIVPLGEEEITIGREAGNTIQLTEQNVSRQHARLTQGPDGWVLEDLDSYNGIKVNGVPIEAQITLNEGDLVQIGDYHLSLAENAEKAALNVDKPGVAANSNEVGDVLPPSTAAGAATSAPAAVVAAAAMAPAATHEAPSYESDSEPEKKSSGGGLIFILLFLGLCAGAYFMFLRGDSTKSPTDTREGPAVVASAGTPEDASAKPTTPENPPDSGSEPVNTPPEDSAGSEPVDSAGPPADSAGPPADSAGSEPEPAVQPTKKKKKTGPKKKKKKNAPEPVPLGDPAELLGDARKASLAGNASQAYKLAKQSYTIDKNKKALKMMGVSACKMGDAVKAQKVYDKVDANTKKALVSLCNTKGVTLQ